MNQIIKRRMSKKQVTIIDGVVLGIAVIVAVLFFLMAFGIALPEGNFLRPDGAFNVSTLCTYLGVIASVAVAVMTSVNSYAKGKTIKEAISDGKEAMSEFEADNIIQNFVLDAVAHVENAYKTFTGEDKKIAAMTEIHQKLLDKGIPFDEKYISDTVEKFISYTKVINAKNDQKL